MLCEITVKYYISVIYSKTTIHQCGKVKYATELGHLCGSVLPFLVTMSCRIRLLTVEHIPLCTAKQLGSSITKLVHLYARGSFVILIVLMDQEFEKLLMKYPNSKSIPPQHMSMW